MKFLPQKVSSTGGLWGGGGGVDNREKVGTQ